MYKYIGVVLTPALVLFCIYNLGLVNLKLKDYILTLLGLIALMIPLMNHEKYVIPAIVLVMMGYIYLKEKNIILSLISPILAIIVFFLSDAINVNLILGHIFKITPKVLRESKALFIIMYYFTAFIVCWGICCVIKKLMDKNINLKEITFRNKFNVFIILVILLTFAIFYINMAYFMDVQNISNVQIKLNTIMFILYFIILVVVSLAFYTNIKKEMEISHKKIEFEQLKEYTKNLESLYNEMRGFRHDYVNILSSMISYMDENDMEGLKTHFKNNIMATGKDMEKGNFRLGNLKNIEVQEIKGLLSSKFIRAQELSIETFIDIVEPIKNINMGIVDLCRVLGIIIDNAVEAASICDKKELKLAIVNKKNSSVIVVINSCPKNTPPIHKIFEKGFSTKGEKRGLGLHNLNEIVDRYKNVALDTFIENDNFTQVLEVFN